MAGRGVHFALTPEEETRLMDEPDANDEGLLAVIGEIEERWDREWLCETDKAWDAIHRCLTDGRLEYGRTPLHMCILGKDNLIEGGGYVLNFLESDEVADVYAAIRGIDQAWFRRKYGALDPSDYDGPIGEEDFRYTWIAFSGLRDFYERAAASGRSVVFTVDL